MKIKIAPGILDADLGHLADAIAEVEQAGADLLHVDVMDGHFVPNILAGPRIVAAVKKYASVPIDVHLMISDPLRYAPTFIEAGADIVIFHPETVGDPEPLLELIKGHGRRCGVALNPHTPASAIARIAGELDCVVAMTVEPGFSSQSFMQMGCEKIPRLRQMCGSDTDIYVDGGIGPSTAPIAVGCGANVLAAASSIFHADLPPGQALRRLRSIAEAQTPASKPGLTGRG